MVIPWAMMHTTNTTKLTYTFFRADCISFRSMEDITIFSQFTVTEDSWPLSERNTDTSTRALPDAVCPPNLLGEAAMLYF